MHAQVPPGLTKIQILDYSITQYVNLEADIYFPEDQGVIQVENFGVHLNADGSVLYGMQIEAVMDRVKDGISLDHLSRLLVDIHQDSSRTVDSFISTVQLKYLDLIFSGPSQPLTGGVIVSMTDFCCRRPFEQR